MLATLDTAMIQAISRRKLMTLPAIQKGEALSDYVFTQYAHWIERRLEYRNRVVNCTAQGVILNGLSHVLLETLLQRGGLPAMKKKVKADSGGVLTTGEAKAFLEDMKYAVQKVRTETTGDRVSKSLKSPDHVFHTIFAEAEKMHPDSESLNAYLTLFLSFMNRHINRALLRIEKSDAG